MKRSNFWPIADDDIQDDDIISSTAWRIPGLSVRLKSRPNNVPAPGQEPEKARRSR